MATKIDVINNALAYIGTPKISSIETAGNVGDICDMFYKLHYPLSLGIPRHWTFSRKQQLLNRLDEESSFSKFDYVFSLPHDLVVPKSIVDSYKPHNFMIGAGRKFYANENSIRLEYSSNVPIESVPDYFIAYLSLRLGADIAIPIAQRDDKAMELRKFADEALEIATFLDAQSIPNEELGYSLVYDMRTVRYT